MADNTEWDKDYHEITGKWRPKSVQKDIEELEKKYYNFYLELLRENEEYIKAQFQKMSGRLELAETYLLENVIAIGFQELVRSIFFRNTDYDVYMLPTSSDTSFESSDAIIQIDIKTIKSGDIYGDDGMRIIPHPNQSTYPGVNEQNSKPFVPALKTQIDNKIYVTFFVRLVWEWVDETKKHSSGIKISEFTLDSIPNGELEPIYGNLIIGAKTYMYPTGTAKEDKIKNKANSPHSIIDAARFTMEPNKTNPRLTTGWTRRTTIFGW